MYCRNKSGADHRQRGGLVSHFLLGTRDVPDTPLAVTWVDVQPGSQQTLHHHPETQVYVIVAGVGEMVVGDEKRHVTAGDLIYIPSDVVHGIVNTGDAVLMYVSAATPPINLHAAYDQGFLTPDAS
ncbi:MAG: cupin domain-containing protein [Anaerolineae bacterium]|nr:cupin domain-containing protein [Anaerolineae bacterium]